MEKIAIIGAGISGLTCAHRLKDKYEVSLFEKDNSPGGLVKCRRINGNLFHTCGGHVFNSKRQDVLDWFWSKFNKEDEFTKADRNSCVFFDREPNAVPYPVENHIYLFDKKIQESFYCDLDEIDTVKGVSPSFEDYNNFGDFLRWRFGKTLYDLYFKPYNEKVWRRDLTTVPMSWMEGKLPMPTTEDMRRYNQSREKEKAFVHSTFWYEKSGGSQYIADKLSEGLNIRYNSDISSIERDGDTWIILGEKFTKVVFCGNVKDMVKMIKGVDVSAYIKPVEKLGYHGTTAVFCEIDANPYSWIYQPSAKHESHRIICTGNFSPTNNNSSSIPEGRITATIEFTDKIDKEKILKNLNEIPLRPKYLDHQYNQYTYPIQNADTRELINEIKNILAPFGFYFTGRFADWEYYNMDVAMGAAIDLCRKLL